MADQTSKKLTEQETLSVGKYMHQNREALSNLSRDEAREKVIEETGIAVAKGTFDRITSVVKIKYSIKRPGGLSKGLESLQDEIGSEIPEDQYVEEEGQS